ncbi:unnamed protein product [Kuraishia capsulata CBS 1993]|uniref:EamA domain-containing protein n=1 Tax=Kuraishia capsulata CBS 1993 TaxID=1382522 RepID=W6MLU8_9ASCO|nr:uncharacterized protein KUCA_T00003459001 [Kuraishia capsulata CBS 1993]CDK27481.1 unnamed protein product [Kuraishia capsulata CBS 1993]
MSNKTLRAPLMSPSLDGQDESFNLERPSHDSARFGLAPSTSLGTSVNGDIAYSAGKIVFVVFLFIISLVAFVAQTESTSYLYSSTNFKEPFLLLYMTHGMWWITWPLQVAGVATWKTYIKFQAHRNNAIESYSDLLRHEREGNNRQGRKVWKGFRKTFTSSVKAQHRNIFESADLTAQENVPGYKSPLVRHHEGSVSKHPKTYYLMFFSQAMRHTVGSAFIIMIVLNIAGSSWYVAMGLSTGSDVTAIYNCSAFAAYAFAVPYLGERFSWLKMLSVLVAVLGVFVVAYSGSSGADNDSSKYPHRLLGNLIILAGAVLYGFYEVLYKKLMCPPSSAVSARRQATFSNFAMSVIGFWTFSCLWIPLLLVHVTNIHRFSFPASSLEWGLILASLLSNICFSCSFLALMALTSPVLSSVASLLTIMLVGVFEWVAFGIKVSSSQLLGYLLVVVGFGVLTYASWSEISEEELDEGGHDTDSDSVASGFSGVPLS